MAGGRWAVTWLSPHDESRVEHVVNKVKLKITSVVNGFIPKL